MDPLIFGRYKDFLFVKDSYDLIVGISMHDHIKNTSYNLCGFLVHIECLLIIRLAVISIWDCSATP